MLQLLPHCFAITVMFRTQIQCYFHSVPPSPSQNETSSEHSHCVVPLYCADLPVGLKVQLFPHGCSAHAVNCWRAGTGTLAFGIAKTSSTLPCIQQELYYVLLNGWRVLILHDRTYKIHRILNVHFKMLSIKCWANNT